MRPVGVTLRGVLKSFRDTGGIERLMDYIFYQVAAVNGFDAVGHYLRAELIVNQCAGYALGAGRGLLGEVPGRLRVRLGGQRQPPAPSTPPATTRCCARRRSRSPGPSARRSRRSQEAGEGRRRPTASKKHKKTCEGQVKQAHPEPREEQAHGEVRADGVPAGEEAAAGADPVAGRSCGAAAGVAAATARRRRRAGGDGPAAPTADPPDALLDYLFGKDGRMKRAAAPSRATPC